MATATITRVITGDVSDLSSVTLLTLVRADTGDNVSFGSSAFSQSGTTWSFTFTTPADSLTYAYTYRRTFSDGSHIDGAGTLVDSISDTDVLGTYGSKAGVRIVYGQTNADTYSNRQGGSTADNATYAYFLDNADTMINAAWLEAGETVPIASTDDRFNRLREIADEWTGAKMYQSRGINDATGDGAKLSGVMSGHVDHAERVLSAMVRLWRKQGTAPTAGVSDLASQSSGGIGYRPVGATPVWGLAQDGL